MKTHTQKTLKIAIIGAGPAGALAGHLLAKQGHEIHLFEKQVTTKRKICGEYLCPKGVELLDQIGLLKDISEQFSHLYGMKIVGPQNIELTTFFPNKHYGLSLNRQKFDSYLQEKLKLNSNITWHQNQALEKINKTKNGWKIQTDKLEDNFDFVIAADGIHSTVAQQLGHNIPVHSKRIALHVFLPLKNSKHYSRIGQMHIFKDGSYCGLDPINENEINFSIVCDAKLLKEMRPFELINYYIKESPFLSEMFDLISSNEKVTTITPLRKKNSLIAGDGLAYVGDAAGFIDPLTGEGIYNALLSAKLIADAIATNDLESALKIYKTNKKKIGFQKNILNTFFQFVIKSPLLCYVISKFLYKNQNRANAFIGIIGNIYSPIVGLWKMLMA